MLAGMDRELSCAERALAQYKAQDRFSQTDHKNALLEIKAGAGGIEAEDFARMLLRMYEAWARKAGFEVLEIAVRNGTRGGVRHARIVLQGPNAYGWLRAEQGVHRLTRKSPYGPGTKQTSFASITVQPQQESLNTLTDIRDADIELEVFRSSGKGGQHVNKANSAVRLRHAPSGLVVTCQAERSQHANRAKAKDKLKVLIHKAAEEERSRQQKLAEEGKPDIRFGQQIRTYAVDQSRITDLRTNIELYDIQAVLNGKIDVLLEAGIGQGRGK